uniref:G_PROTEIN_RECEP_F1_2 domain-containing protein n=1 Tax=Heterorhabditis bacteriophora TaxID=37862 RepID=A0A1I7X5E0_HETBA
MSGITMIVTISLIGVTIIDILNLVLCKDLVQLDNCQLLLAELWHGSLRVRSGSNLRVLTALLCPPAALALAFKTPRVPPTLQDSESDKEDEDSTAYDTISTFRTDRADRETTIGGSVMSLHIHRVGHKSQRSLIMLKYIYIYIYNSIFTIFCYKQFFLVVYTCFSLKKHQKSGKNAEYFIRIYNHCVIPYCPAGIFSINHTSCYMEKSWSTMILLYFHHHSPCWLISVVFFSVFVQLVYLIQMFFKINITRSDMSRKDGDERRLDCSMIQKEAIDSVKNKKKTSKHDSTCASSQSLPESSDPTRYANKTLF